MKESEEIDCGEKGGEVRDIIKNAVYESISPELDLKTKEKKANNKNVLTDIMNEDFR